MGEVKSGRPPCEPAPQGGARVGGCLGGDAPDQPSKEGLTRLLQRKRQDNVNFRGGLLVPETCP